MPGGVDPVNFDLTHNCEKVFFLSSLLDLALVHLMFPIIAICDNSTEEIHLALIFVIPLYHLMYNCLRIGAIFSLRSV